MLLIGCGQTSEERVLGLQDMITKAQVASIGIDEEVPKLVSALSQARTLLEDPTLDENTVGNINKFIDKVNGELESLVTYKATIEKAVASWQVEIDRITDSGDIGIGAELQILGAGATAVSSGIPPPYGPILALGGIVLTLVGGIVSTRRAANKSSPADVEIKSKIMKANLGDTTDSSIKTMEILNE